MSVSFGVCIMHFLDASSSLSQCELQAVYLGCMSRLYMYMYVSNALYLLTSTTALFPQHTLMWYVRMYTVQRSGFVESLAPWSTYYYVSFNLATSARSSSACAIALCRSQQDLPASLLHLHLSQFLALLARHATQFVLGFGNDPDRRVSFQAFALLAAVASKHPPSR
jgi:hypothetical protein